MPAFLVSLGAGDIPVNRRDKICDLMEISFQWGKTGDNKTDKENIQRW